jgi:hypothetical protein
VVHYPAVPVSVRAARRDAGVVVRGWGLDVLADVVGLLVGELAANAVQACGRCGDGAPDGPDGAGLPGRGRIALRLTRADADLVVEVWDGSDGVPMRRAADPDGTCQAF